MKLAIAFPGCHRRGGVERIVYEIAHFMACAKHEVTVFAAEHEADEACGSSIRYESVPMTRRPWFVRPGSFFRACSERLDLNAFDAVSTHGCVSPFGGAHWVQSVHRAWLERSSVYRSALSLSRIKQRLNPIHGRLLELERRHFAERRYKRVVVTTKEVGKDLNRFYGVPWDDVTVLPNGFSPTEFNPARRASRREAERARLGLEERHQVLVFVANELERKGYRTVLEAMRRLNDPNLKLLVVGRAKVSEVNRLAGEFGLQHQVVACGPTADVAAFHAAADLFVLPTQYEAFCLAILEALGSGLPVITSMVPGARDAIRVGENGLLIEDPLSGAELAEAIRELIEPSRRMTFEARAPDSVAQYQWPRILAEYEGLLKS